MRILIDCHILLWPSGLICYNVCAVRKKLNRFQGEGGEIMAKPIELGLELNRAESIRFQKYIDNPQYTTAGRQLIREAAEIAKKPRV